MLSEFISEYGYLAVFIGTIIEGESILLLAGFSAHRGYLALPLVIVLAAAGGALGDFLVFMAGRRYGASLLQRHPKWRPGVKRVTDIIHRREVAAIIGVRFMYGLRIAGPLAIGMSAVPIWRFVVYNVVGALLWATIITGAGYVFGHAIETILDDIKRYEEGLLVLVLAIGLVWVAMRRWRLKRHAAVTPADQHTP